MKVNPAFVYINPYAGFFLDHQELKEFLNHKLCVDQWEGYTNDLTALTRYFKEGTYDEVSVLNGISITQYFDSLKDGGTHVNPALLGLLMDTNRWADIMGSNKVQPDIKFIDIPYEFYKNIAQEKAVDKDEYNWQNDALKKMVEAFPGYISQTIH